MKKLICLALSIVMAASLVACGGQEKESDVFKPSMDVNAACNLKVVGSYDNFEALEAEFDRFNEYYPHVELEYVKVDDYNNNIANVLESNDRPNIFFSYTWMMGDSKYAPVVSHMENLSASPIQKNLDCLRPGLVNHDASGNVLMIPVFSRTYGTLVNNDLFKKEGLTVPTTWTQLVNTCNSFKEKGYVSPMMGYSLKSSSSWMNTIAYPMFLAALANNPTALAQANNLDPAAGEYMRSALTMVQTLSTNGAFNMTECDKIGDNYNKVILRFFEGDVPMMVCAGDTVSGTKKRESQSEAFVKSPFEYSFVPIPVTEQGGYFIDSPSIQFSVNKNCENLDMTNEFMRFLVCEKELNEMATAKRLVSPTKVMSLESVYAPFGNVPAERTFSPEALGVKDTLATQIRIASYKVVKENLPIDDAIAQYGTFK